MFGPAPPEPPRSTTELGAVLSLLERETTQLEHAWQALESLARAIEAQTAEIRGQTSAIAQALDKQPMALISALQVARDVPPEVVARLSLFGRLRAK